SLVHDIPLSGAVVVTTPQAVALSDVEKSVNMFRNPQVDKPILGIVENMSWFTPAELPDNKYYIFGRDGGQMMADKYGIPLLGQIPLVQSVREGGDEGAPAALEDGPLHDAMKACAEQIVRGV
ncbi:MAG: P-loop NTPase, partial [Bacteroidales bacterium]|nr:P-loop NTPase [Bacteroidales bacterium]